MLMLKKVKKTNDKLEEISLEDDTEEIDIPVDESINGENENE